MSISTKPFARPASFAVAAAWCLLSVFAHPAAQVFAQEVPPPNLKIAFIGDQSLGPDALAVLNLIKLEGAQAVLHSGDLDYADDPAAWEAQLDSVLGADFPYFVTIGNHDELKWAAAGGYQQRVEGRFTRLGIAWSGRLGVRSSFHYKGVFFVLAAPGIGSGFDDGASDLYVRDQLAADNSVWSVCSWHKNQRLMQVGGKTDETGWGVYEEARKGGAIIATAHEHSYSRTHLLGGMSSQTVASTSNTLSLTKGKSFAFVSGLGGQSTRPQLVGGSWWASAYASTCLAGEQYCQPNAAPGALFGVFNVDGQPNKALFYFKDINGKVVDSFVVYSNVEAPQLSAVTPASADAGGAAFTLSVDGANFVNGSVVQWNGMARPTAFVSPTRLTAAIPATDIAAQGSALLTVANPAPDGGTSNAVTLHVNNPAPSVASLEPAAAVAGGEPLTLTVNGTGFNASSVVRFANSDRPTAFVSVTKLAAALAREDTAAAGTFDVTVFNPAPGGGLSGAATLTVNNPVPTLGALSPDSGVAGGGGLTLSLTGTNFNASSVVRWGGSPRPIAFIDAAHLTAQIGAADVASPGVIHITVSNPSPGGGTSAALDFTVEPAPNPAPSLASLSPDNALKGGGAFTLTVVGSSFVSGAVVSFNGATRTTRFIGATQLEADITAADIENAGAFPVTVSNPAPGGGASNVKTFKVEPPPPRLLTEEGTGRAIALSSVTWLREPFALTTPYNLSPDTRTRVMLFAADIDPSAVGNPSLVTAQAEDALDVTYTLPVEFVGTVPGQDWLTQIVVILPAELANAGEVRVQISVRGTGSNKAPLSINPSSSGP